VLISFNESVVTSSPLPFGSISKVDGDVLTQSYNVLSVGTGGNLDITWDGPATASQLKITHIRLVSLDVSPLSIKLSASFLDGNTVISTSDYELNGLRDRPDVVVLKFTLPSSVTTPSIILTLEENANLTALAVNQVQCASLTANTLTPNAPGLGNYAMAMLTRAFASVVDSFNAIETLVDPRVQVSTGVYVWTLNSTKSWVSQLLTTETRLLQAFRTGGPLDVGRPAVIPRGLEYVLPGNSSGLTAGSIWAKDAGVKPELVAVTAWMLTQRFLVANDSYVGQGS
jgi:hypothetical protein